MIIFSTSFEQEVVNLLYKNGAQYFIRKPSEFSQFKKIIHQTFAYTYNTTKYFTTDQGKFCAYSAKQFDHLKINSIRNVRLIGTEYMTKIKTQMRRSYSLFAKNLLFKMKRKKNGQQS